MQQFIKYIDALNLYFNSAVHLMKNFFIVCFNESSWANSICTCYFYFKKYICIHIVALAVNLGIIDIPAKYRTTNIGCKTTKGRKKRAMDALKRQYN